MFVSRVVVPSSRRESWTVIGQDEVPIDPVERYLAYLTDVKRSPNTVKAYARDLKDWFVFLASRSCDWREVRLEGGAWSAWGSGCGNCATGGGGGRMTGV
jgi:integrase/recombinase XerD